MNSNSINSKLFGSVDKFLSKPNVPLFLFLLFLIYHLFKIPLQTAGVDTGYFLSISRDLYTDGLLPLSELRTIYTPIGYYFFGLPFLFFKDNNITHFYYFNLFLVSLCCFLFLVVVKNYGFKNKYWILLVFFLTISPLIYDIKLELIVLLFSVIAYYFNSKYFLSRKTSYLFLSGLAVGLAVLTKQYALLIWFMTLLFLLSFSSDRNKINYKSIMTELMFFSSGIMSVLLMFFSFYLVNIGTDTKYLMDQFLGKVYYDCLGLYGTRVISNLLMGIKYYTKFTPYVLFIPLLLLCEKNKHFIKNHLNLLILFGASLIPYYFQIYPHYYYFGFVPVFLLSIKIFQDSKYGNFILPFFLFPVLINLYSIYVLKRDYSVLKLRKEVDTEFYNQIRKYVPVGSRSFVEGKKQVYFECGLKSVHDKNIGYDYVPSLCIDYLLADSLAIVNKFYYVGPNKDLTFAECTRLYIGETPDLDGFAPHYIYLFDRNR
jgi:hypothetical protein